MKVWWAAKHILCDSKKEALAKFGVDESKLRALIMVEEVEALAMEAKDYRELYFHLKEKIKLDEVQLSDQTCPAKADETPA